MKRLKYAVILLLGLSMATMMTSCNKESSYKDKIVGEWQMIKETHFTYDLSGNLIDESSYDYSWIFKFYSEGLVKVPGSFLQKSNYDDCLLSYVIDGNSLLFAITDEIEEYTIVELTKSTMVWENEYVSSYSNRKYVERYELKKVN